MDKYTSQFMADPFVPYSVKKPAQDFPQEFDPNYYLEKLSREGRLNPERDYFIRRFDQLYQIAPEVAIDMLLDMN